jgi:PAS domain S-box-containing protein
MVFFISTITASHFLTRYSFSSLEKYQIVVNKASEINDIADQVVYHANLVMDSKSVVDARNAQSKLADNLAEYQVVIDLLKTGGKEEVAGEEVVLPACEESLKPQLIKIGELWEIYKAQSQDVVNAEITPSFIAGDAQTLEIRNRILEKVNYLNTNRLRLFNLQKKFTDSYIALSRQQKDYANNLLWGLWIMNLALVGLGAWLIMFWVVQPIRQISVIAHKISEGDLSQTVQYDRENEVGEVAIALNNMVQKIRSATDFIRNIEEGNLDVSYKEAEPYLNGQSNSKSVMDSKRDALANALINMRERMKTVAVEESERNWATRGLAMFGEILQDYHDTTETLAYEVISNLVKYMDANQGAVFLVNDEAAQNKKDGSSFVFLDLIAAYAYNKRKFLNKRVLTGEGLVGQSFKDADVIYISDIPADYADITSGLGGAQPKSVLVVPLKLSDRVYGVVEIASFYEIPKYQIEFLEKLSENIASNLYTSRVNENTKRLLQESNVITAQMQEQKAEMEKNMQILEQTQEKMQRNQEALSAQSYAIQNTLITIEMEMNGVLLKCNDLFLQKFGYKSEEEVLGQNYRTLTVPAGQIYETQAERMWRELDLGRPVTSEVKRKTKQGKDIWLRVTHSPIKNTQGVPYKIFMLAFDITEDKRLRQEFKEQLDSFKRSNAIVEFSLEGKIIEANQAFLDIMEYEREEIIGQEHLIIVPPNERQAAAYQALWHKLKQGNYHVGEVRRITKSGKIVWFQGSFNPILDLNGKPYKIVEVIIDVTDRKNAEARILATQAELRQKEEDLTALINNTDDAIYTVGKNYRVTLLNDSTKRLFDALGETVRMGVDVLEALPKNYYTMWKGYYDRALAGEKFGIEQAIFSEGNRNKIYLSVSFNPILNDQGEVQGVAVFARDITARKQREMDIAEFTKKQNQRTQRIIENQKQTLQQSTDNFEKEVNALKETIYAQEKQLDTLNRNKKYQSRSTEILWVFDTNLEVSYYNQAASDYLRQWHIYIQPHYFVPDMFPQNRFYQWEKLCYRALHGEHFEVWETVGNRHSKLGESILVEFTPIFNEFHQVIQVMVSVKSITNILHQYRARLAKHKQRLVERHKQKLKNIEKEFHQKLQTVDISLQEAKKVQEKLQLDSDVWQKIPACTILLSADGLAIAYNLTAKKYLRDWHIFLQPDYLVTDMFPQKLFYEWEQMRVEAWAGKPYTFVTHLYNRYKREIRSFYVELQPQPEGTLLLFKDLTGILKRK